LKYRSHKFSIHTTTQKSQWQKHNETRTVLNHMNNTTTEEKVTSMGKKHATQTHKKRK